MLKTPSRHDDAAAVLYFLLYLKRDVGGNTYQGGHKLDDVIESAARLSGLSKTGLLALEEQV